MISFVIPTRDRPQRLVETLSALGSLDAPGEVVVIDNASTAEPAVPARLANSLPVHLIRSDVNLGAAARNLGVQRASPAHEWIVMLDDDSHPMDAAFIAALERQPADVAAVSADIFLPRLNRRESGGLPEVFIGCGVAVRRRVFLDLGGYDARFQYYAEEYDLAAKMLLAGHRVAFEPAFRVAHWKDGTHRDMNTILARLVRNNGWVMQRYAPDSCRRERIREDLDRYRAIAEKENAERGFAAGLTELRRTLREQRRTPMPPALFDRFTGLAHARASLADAWREQPFRTAAIIDEGKNGWAVHRALVELGVRVIDEPTAEARVVGTLSPGPMLDAAERGFAAGARVIAPFRAATVRERATAPSSTPSAPSLFSPPSSQHRPAA